jgi:deoxycytidylate deaminase
MSTNRVVENLFVAARDLENTNRAKIVAAIRVKNKIISMGYNDMKTHPFQQEYSKNEHAIYWHAETRAIHNALRVANENDLKRSTLFVVRSKKSVYNDKHYDVCGLAKPCEGCMKAIKQYGIKKVVYSCDAMINETSYAVINNLGGTNV